jgi:hypothetical protein
MFGNCPPSEILSGPSTCLTFHTHNLKASELITPEAIGYEIDESLSNYLIFNVPGSIRQQAEAFPSLHVIRSTVLMQRRHFIPGGA